MDRQNGFYTGFGFIFTGLLTSPFFAHPEGFAKNLSGMVFGLGCIMVWRNR